MKKTFIALLGTLLLFGGFFLPNQTVGQVIKKFNHELPDGSWVKVTQILGSVNPDVMVAPEQTTLFVDSGSIVIISTPRCAGCTPGDIQLTSKRDGEQIRFTVTGSAPATITVARDDLATWNLPDRYLGTGLEIGSTMALGLELGSNSPNQFAYKSLRLSGGAMLPNEMTSWSEVGGYGQIQRIWVFNQPFMIPRLRLGIAMGALAGNFDGEFAWAPTGSLLLNIGAQNRGGARFAATILGNPFGESPIGILVSCSLFGLTHR